MDSLDKTPSAPEPDLLSRLRIRESQPVRRRQIPLSLRERYVLCAVLPLIVLSPLHAGSMFWWSGLLNCALALLPVIAAVIPLRSEYPDPAPSYSSAQVFKNLLKFPIFWLGLLFLGYIAIQALNYNWELMWTEGKRGFYMQKLADDQYIHWLPSGMNTPFKMRNPWQALLLWAVPWLAICAMWCSFKRPKSWRIVLWMIAVTGTLVTLLSIAAKITAPDKLLWIWESTSKTSFGPYVYRNQASVLLYMAMASAFSLFFYYQRSQNRDSGIQWVAMLLGLVSLGGSAMSFSRAGWIGTGIVIAVGVALFVLQLMWQRDHSWKLILFQVLLFVCIASAAGYLLSKVDFSPIKTKWERTFNVLDGEVELDSGILARKKVAEKTLIMFKDNPVTGWGANSFRFYFPVYQQEDDTLLHPMGSRGKLNYKKRLFWTDAHSDWVQLLAEYGIVGCSFLLLGLLYWLGGILLRLRSLHCEHWMLLAGVATMIFQSVLDIVFYNPSLVIVFSLVLCSARGMLIRPQSAPAKEERVTLGNPSQIPRGIRLKADG